MLNISAGESLRLVRRVMEFLFSKGGHVVFDDALHTAGYDRWHLLGVALAP